MSAGIVMDIEVRWGDMDAMGHVNNVMYFEYLESARIRYYETLGLDTFKQLPTDGPGLVHTELNFRRQVRYPATVRISANVTRIGRRSFKLEYRLIDLTTGEECAWGASTNVWVDYAAGRARELPAGLIEAIRNLEGRPELGTDS